jgi:hypothetical protein
MGQSAAAANLDLFSMLAKLPQTLFGSKSSVTSTTGGGTVTEQSGFSPEALEALLKSIMEGTTGRPGLAQIAAGQKAPGLYNSTTRGLLVNDFTTRAAAEVAKAAAPRVTTTTPRTTVQQTQVPGVGKGGLALGALAVLGSKKGRGKITDIFDEITGAFKGTDSVINAGGLDVSGGAAEAIMNSIPGFSAPSAGGFDITGVSSFADNFDLLGQNIGGFFDFSDGGVIDNISSIGSLFDSTSSGFEAMQAIDDLDELSGFVDGAGSLGGIDGIDIGLPAGAGKLLSGDVEGAAGSFLVSQIPVVGPVIGIADALFGTDIGGQVGSKVFDDILGITDGGGSVICTELTRQGKLSKHLLQAETKLNRAYLPDVVFRGYHKLAIPVVRKMRKSERLSNFLLPWVESHCRFTMTGVGDYRAAFIGSVLIPICYVIGSFSGKQDYKSLYAGA